MVLNCPVAPSSLFALFAFPLVGQRRHPRGLSRKWLIFLAVCRCRCCRGSSGLLFRQPTLLLLLFSTLPLSLQSLSLAHRGFVRLDDLVETIHHSGPEARTGWRCWYHHLGLLVSADLRRRGPPESVRLSPRLMRGRHGHPLPGVKLLIDFVSHFFKVEALVALLVVWPLTVVRRMRLLDQQGRCGRRLTEGSKPEGPSLITGHFPLWLLSTILDYLPQPCV